MAGREAGKTTWADVRLAMSELGKRRSEWAGYPMPHHSLKLRVEPKYPYAIDGFRFDKEEEKPVTDPIEIRNSWYSSKLSSEVTVYVDESGLARGFVDPQYGGNPLMFQLNTLLASEVWSREMEDRALAKLSTLIRPEQFDKYCLAGAFLETSKRSGVSYLFRKLRPTVAIRVAETGSRILAVLCLHPIGHYESSWAGAMTPTDDLLAHLLLMRGCEPKFWARANHIPCHAANAGL